MARKVFTVRSANVFPLTAEIFFVAVFLISYQYANGASGPDSIQELGGRLQLFFTINNLQFYLEI